MPDEMLGEVSASPDAPAAVALHDAAPLAPEPKHAEMDAEKRGRGLSETFPGSGRAEGLHGE
jgi:hypothetical protein